MAAKTTGTPGHNSDAILAKLERRCADGRNHAETDIAIFLPDIVAQDLFHPRSGKRLRSSVAINRDARHEAIKGRPQGGENVVGPPLPGVRLVDYQHSARQRSPPWK